VKKPSEKGYSFERSTCREFSLWFSGNKTDGLFWRTSGSGSRATRRNQTQRKLTKFQHGDMTYDDPEGRPLVEDLCFEFKRYHQIAVFSVLYKMHPNNSLLSFWAQAHRDATASARHPVLITRVDRGQSIMWVQSNVLLFALRHHCSFNPVSCIQFSVPRQIIVIKAARKTKQMKRKIPEEVYDLPAQEVIGFPLSDFFKHVDPAEFLSAVSARSLGQRS
jgi:hypothetical protein